MWKCSSNSNFSSSYNFIGTRSHSSVYIVSTVLLVLSWILVTDTAGSAKLEVLLSDPSQKKFADSKSSTAREYSIPEILACLKLFFYTLNNWKTTCLNQILGSCSLFWVIWKCCSVPTLLCLLSRCLMPNVTFLSFLCKWLNLLQDPGDYYFFFIIKGYYFS